MNAETTATRTERTFHLEYSVAVPVAATPDTLWRHLTDLPGFKRWNTTVSSISGEVAVGARLQLEVPLAPGRTFKPRVAALESGRRMVWRDGQAPFFVGERTFTLTPREDGTTEFKMVETFRGAMLPLIKRALPDFRAAFDQYAADLKRAAEAA
jgi:hypothetical protein